MVEINKVIILSWMSPYIKFGGYRDAHKIEFYPERYIYLQNYAIVELIKSKVFVAVRAIEITEKGLVGEYMDSYEVDEASDDLRSTFFIDWSTLDVYGYVTLMCKSKDGKI